MLIPFYAYTHTWQYWPKLILCNRWLCVTSRPAFFQGDAIVYAYQQLWSLAARIFTNVKDSCTKRHYVHLRTIWIKPAATCQWRPALHETAIPLSRSPQHIWWGLVLAEMRPDLAKRNLAKHLGMMVHTDILETTHMVYKWFPVGRAYTPEHSLQTTQREHTGWTSRFLVAFFHGRISYDCLLSLSLLLTLLHRCLHN